MKAIMEGRYLECDQDLTRNLALDLDIHFESMVRSYQDRLYAFVLRLGLRTQDAEEVVQDAFVKAYRAMSRYDAEQVRSLTLRAWLYRITLNTVRNRVRRRQPTTTSLDEAGTGAAVAAALADRDGPAEHLERSERRAELAKALAYLPQRYRQAVTLRHVASLSYSETAVILSRPVGTVKSDVHRGLIMLRDNLQHTKEGRLT
jgi:RNA polymerase sigma-70 factor (ECF subfamily)